MHVKYFTWIQVWGGFVWKPVSRGEVMCLWVAVCEHFLCSAGRRCGLWKRSGFLDPWPVVTSVVALAVPDWEVSRLSYWQRLGALSRCFTDAAQKANCNLVCINRRVAAGRRWGLSPLLCLHEPPLDCCVWAWAPQKKREVELLEQV